MPAVTFLLNDITLLLAQFTTLSRHLSLKACSVLTETDERESGNALLCWLLYNRYKVNA